MRSYLLLRDNEQSGPYSREELASIRLRSLDLVWENGGSESWKYPTEIDELKYLVETSNTSLHPAGGMGGRTHRRFHSTTAAPQLKNNNFSDISYAIPTSNSYNEIKYQQSIDDLKNLYRRRWQQRKAWTRKLLPDKRLINLVLIVGGVFLGALLVKKGVDHLDIPGSAGEAPPVQTESLVMPAQGNDAEIKLIRIPAVPADQKK